MTKDDIVAPFKICLVGDTGTGKTSLFSRLSKNEFHLEYEPTNGVELKMHQILVNNKSINTIIWDIPGGTKHRPLADSLYHDADGILLVYDITDDNNTTFENIPEWIKNIISLANPKSVIKLVGNKSDLEHQRVVSLEKAQTLADDYGVSFTEISALDNRHITQSFLWTIQQICSVAKSSIGNSESGLFSTCAFISNCMSRNIHVLEHQLQDLSFSNTQEQQRPFHVVLIDLKKAAEGIIHCVEKPLEDDNLKYVALSYRWGELQETLIDTGLGYTATVTSFRLYHFFKLCKGITKESDMKNMDYVWVDAICVDQTNYERRKATIYQMSNIYERASYILAVPDLHLQYLLDTTVLFRDVQCPLYSRQLDIYSLIHGNIADLECDENEFLDTLKVPKDPDLRLLLKSCTNYFTPGFMEYRKRHPSCTNEKRLRHILESYQPATKQNSCGDVIIECRRHPNCHSRKCPLDYFDSNVPHSRNETIHVHSENNIVRVWSERIQERSNAIQNLMKFMKDLIKDWSTRVWVISEYNIARKKNNMKYWFMQLSGYLEYDKNFSFFKFDFEDSVFSNTIENATRGQTDLSKLPIYLQFHQTMIHQLNNQSFLEMMLKSKASKNEDRFYAILPLTDYKNMITNKANVDKWKLDTLGSVKIKLFEIMKTKDKLNLLFISGDYHALQLGTILPTFATSTINWRLTYMDQLFFKDKDEDISQYNFDLDSSDTIKLCLEQNHPYLNLKPKEYCTIGNDAKRCLYADLTLWKQFQPEDPYKTNIYVCIPFYSRAFMQEYVDDDDSLSDYSNDSDDSDYTDDGFTPIVNRSNWVIVLNGNFKNNIWILVRNVAMSNANYGEFIHHTLDDSSPGFNIY